MTKASKHSKFRSQIVWPAPSASEMEGGLMGVIEKSLQLNSWQPAFLKSGEPHFGRFLQGHVEEAVASEVARIKKASANNLAGALFASLVFTKPPWRPSAAALCRKIIPLLIPEAEHSGMQALIAWLASFEKTPGLALWLSGAVSSLNQRADLLTLREIAPEAAFVLWSMELRNDGTREFREPLLPVFGNKVVRINSQFWGRLALCQQGEGNVRLDELEAWGDDLFQQIINSPVMREALMHPDVWNTLRKTTVRASGKHWRLHVKVLVNLESTLDRLRQRIGKALICPGAANAWPAFIDTNPLRRQALSALIAVEPGLLEETPIPGDADLQRAILFAQGSVKDKLQILKAGGKNLCDCLIGILRDSDWDPVFLSADAAVLKKLLGPNGSPLFQRLAQQWFHQKACEEAGLARMQPMKFTKALINMAQNDADLLTSWVRAIPSKSFVAAIKNSGWLRSPLLGSAWERCFKALSDDLDFCVDLLASLTRSTTGNPFISLKRLPKEILDVAVQRLASRPWDGDLIPMGIFIGATFSKRVLEITGGRDQDEAILLKWLPAKVLKSSGLLAKWKSNGVEQWPLNQISNRTTNLQPECLNKLLCFLMDDDDPELFCRCVWPTPLFRQLEAGCGRGFIPELKDFLKNKAKPGIKEREERLRNRLPESLGRIGLPKLGLQLEAEDAPPSWCAEFIGEPGNFGLGQLVAIVKYRKMPVVLLRKVEPERMKTLIVRAKAAVPDRPALWQALEVAALIDWRWFPLLSHLAVRRMQHFRSGLETGHAFAGEYITWELPKRSGGKREITAPQGRLKALQRAVLSFLETHTGELLHDCAHGFVPGRSTLTNATPHSNKLVVVNIDIRGFFPNTPVGHIFRVLRQVTGDKLGDGAIHLLAEICSHNGVLPTGAPTSPWIANLVLSRVDKSLSKACAAAGISYTRYADDLTFSGDSRAVGMIRFARKVLAELGYELDPKKINIFRRGRRQMVTGLVVNEKPHLPRQVRRKIRAAVHAISKGEEPVWHGSPVSKETILGYLGWWNQIEPEKAAPLLVKLKNHFS